LRSTIEQSIQRISRDAAVIEAEVCFSPTAPIFAGHFPGKPIVPAVYQMALCRTALKKYYEGRFLQVRRSRFLALCLPDVPYTLKIYIEDDGASFVATCTIRRGGVIHSKLVLSYEKPARQD
jgi:3-hydroxymyristoyl/3-hydroxydecanoyl-(acyl carrier protein) dehydratase